MSDDPDPPADQSGEVYDDEGWPEEPDDQMVMRYLERGPRDREASKAEPEAPPDEAEEASGESGATEAEPEAPSDESEEASGESEDD